MSNAKTVANDVSQRSRKTQKSKTAFKPVLENPFTIQWPEIALNVQNNILAALVDLLSDLKEYHFERQRGSRKAKRILRQQSKSSIHEKREGENIRKRKDPPGSAQARPAKRKRVEARSGTNTGIEEVASINNPADIASVSNDIISQGPTNIDDVMAALSSTPSPPLLKHISFGLNEVARYLERHISRLRERIIAGEALSEDLSLPYALFVCRWDLNPPTLISHIPHLVASSNTLANLYHAKFPVANIIPDLKLINLPKGAENSLSDCMGVRRVSMVLIDSKGSLGTRLNDMITKVSKLSTPWLLPIAGPAKLSISHIPTHIKHIKTTAPIDLKAAKHERTRGKQEAKRRKRNARKLTETVSVTEKASTTGP